MSEPISSLATTMKVRSEEYHRLFGHHWIKTSGVTWCTMCGEEKEEVGHAPLGGADSETQTKENSNGNS